MSSYESEFEDFDVHSDTDLDLVDSPRCVDSPRYDVLKIMSDRTGDEGDLGFETEYDERPDWASEPSVSPPLSPEADLTCGLVQISGIDSDWNSEPLDLVGLDSQLNAREESDWEEEDEGAIGWTEQVMASPEQEEPLQDSHQEFSFSFFPEGFSVNPNLDSDPEFVIQGDYVDLDESFTAVSQQILRNEIARRDNSPASARVVENLPLITVSEGGLGTGDGLCAVCKDKYVEGEKVKVLPCVHCYHQDCILPWLRMHNTCPVCRFVLPKDDSRLGVRRTVRDGGMHGGGLHSDTLI